MFLPHLKNQTPNLFTLSRLFLTPLCLVLLKKEQNLSAFLVYLLIAFSDYLDGYFARRWNASSNLGIVLDQVCDKLVGLGFFTGLMFLDLCPKWFWVLSLLLTALMALGYLLPQLDPQSSGPQPSLKIGKWAMAIEFVWIGWLILEKILLITTDHQIGFVGLALLRLWVFALYFKRLHSQNPLFLHSLFSDKT